MRRDLTPREAQFMAAFQAHVAKHNAEPTQQELADALGMKFRSQAATMKSRLRHLMEVRPQIGVRILGVAQ